MKKLAALTLVVGAFLMTTGCTTQEEPTPKSEPQTYTAYGRYNSNIEMSDGIYVEGITTNDGNVWEYHADTVSSIPVYDGMPIWAGFSDNGTPDNIEDDIILGLVYDRNTAVYDDLETALGENFTIQRDGNNIKIGELKND